MENDTRQAVNEIRRNLNNTRAQIKDIMSDCDKILHEVNMSQAWSMTKDNKDGLYCISCGVVIYTPKKVTQELKDPNCPMCGSHLNWITYSHQPGREL